MVDSQAGFSTGADRERSSLPGRIWRLLRARVLSGLLMILPFVVTAWLVLWLYNFVNNYAIRPIAHLVIVVIEGRTNAELPAWFVNYAAPLVGVVAVLGLLYFMGLFARARADRILDAVLLKVPVVTSIHKAVRQVFGALGGAEELQKFNRTVLVEFPHPGMRAPAFVTASCKDKVTQRTILCVYVPTTPIPTSGYMLMIPEEKVTDLDWPLDQTIQAVVSFGLTAPDRVRYFADESQPVDR